MKQKRTLIIALLLLTLAGMLLTACINDGGSGGTTSVNGATVTATPVPPGFLETQAANITATFGADEFHAQLTAVAGQNHQP